MLSFSRSFLLPAHCQYFKSGLKPKEKWKSLLVHWIYNNVFLSTPLLSPRLTVHIRQISQWEKRYPAKEFWKWLTLTELARYLVFCVSRCCTHANWCTDLNWHFLALQLEGWACLLTLLTFRRLHSVPAWCYLVVLFILPQTHPCGTYYCDSILTSLPVAWRVNPAVKPNPRSWQSCIVGSSYIGASLNADVFWKWGSFKYPCWHGSKISLSEVLSGNSQGIHQNQADASMNTHKKEPFYAENCWRLEKGLIYLNYPSKCQAPCFLEGSDNCGLKKVCSNL